MGVKFDFGFMGGIFAQYLLDIGVKASSRSISRIDNEELPKGAVLVLCPSCHGGYEHAYWLPKRN
ncbi:MAG: hypothetical protein ACJAR9_001340 [Celeribacter sp.]|jgi:hypothetical protein